MHLLADHLVAMIWMNDKYFLDTNILVYTFDRSVPDKKLVANTLVENALTHKEGVISFQVIQEFINVSTKKFDKPLSQQDAQIYLNAVLSPLCKFHSDTNFYSQALQTKQRWRYSWYDSLIITAALNLNCVLLYSEDFQHNQQLDGMTIVNPFL